MKITLTLIAGIELNDIEAKGFENSEFQKNWDNESKRSHGRDRKSKTSLEGLSGSAKASFDMKIDFDLQPEELESSYNCIEKLVKTADLSPRKGEFCFPENRVIEKICRDFWEASSKARKTESLSDLTEAIYLGNIAKEALDDFGYAKSHRGLVADIEGTISCLKEIKIKAAKKEKAAE